MMPHEIFQVDVASYIASSYRRSDQKPDQLLSGI